MITRLRLGSLAAGLVFIAFVSASAIAQKAAKTSVPAAVETSSLLTSSPAYAEILLKRTELEAELESLLIDFTEEYPKVKADRFSLAQLKNDADSLSTVKGADASKLTLALGKLIVRKVELETDLWNLQQTLADGHPDVKRAKRKVEIYAKAIKEILG